MSNKIALEALKSELRESAITMANLPTEFGVACLTEAGAQRIAKALTDAATALEAMEAGGWLPISEAPKGRKVLAGYKNKLGNWRTVTARYYLPQTLLLEDDRDDLDDDGYAPEGWYEESETQEVILRIEEPPTHFQPLPTPPKEAP